MTLFEQGKKDYVNGVRIQSQTTYKGEYLRGYQWQQKLLKGSSECWMSWPAGYKSSSNIKTWRLGK